MDTIRKYIKEDGSVSYHAEVRLKGAPAERGSFRTKTLAKEWIQRKNPRLETEDIFVQLKQKNIQLKSSLNVSFLNG